MTCTPTSQNTLPSLMPRLCSFSFTPGPQVDDHASLMDILRTVRGNSAKLEEYSGGRNRFSNDTYLQKFVGVAWAGWAGSEVPAGRSEAGDRLLNSDRILVLLLSCFFKSQCQEVGFGCYIVCNKAQSTYNKIISAFSPWQYQMWWFLHKFPFCKYVVFLSPNILKYLKKTKERPKIWTDSYVSFPPGTDGDQLRHSVRKRKKSVRCLQSKKFSYQ